MIVDLGEAIDRKINELLGRRTLYEPPARELSDEEKARREVEIAVLLKARDAICGRCADDEGPHGCRAFAIRMMIARLDPGESDLSPKDWLPRHLSKSGMREEA